MELGVAIRLDGDGHSVGMEVDLVVAHAGQGQAKWSHEDVLKA